MLEGVDCWPNLYHCRAVVRLGLPSFGSSRACRGPKPSGEVADELGLRPTFDRRVCVSILNGYGL